MLWSNEWWNSYRGDHRVLIRKSLFPDENGYLLTSAVSNTIMRTMKLIAVRRELKAASGSHRFLDGNEFRAFIYLTKSFDS
jgi:hypothetical protein